MLSDNVRRLTIAVALLLVLPVLATGAIAEAQTIQPTGGFIELASSQVPRATPRPSAVALPVRGAFTFPSPYDTTAFRITTAADCGGGDCVRPVGYSYWTNINNHAGSDTMLIFLGLDRSRGGAGPTLFSVNKRTGETRNEGGLFPATHPLQWGSGEGWYFSAQRQHTLYVNDLRKLYRYDVRLRTLETVLDVTPQFGANRELWQMHSSGDDRVHSATLRDVATKAVVGCVAYREDRRQWYFASVIGAYDECQIDKSGRWLVIKENVDGRNQEDNRVLDLTTGVERRLLDENGAGGHSDMGYGYMVALDNYNRAPGAVRVWRFDRDVTGGQPVASVPGQGTLVYQLSSWQGSGGHIAHSNARPDLPLEQQVACSSSATRLTTLPRVNDIVCYRLDGTLETLVVAPNLTSLDASGGNGVGGEYNKLPKGNLDPTGEYFIWSANVGTSRLDAFVVRVPKQLLLATATAVWEPVRWTSRVNATATSSLLQKTGGCQGCPDAGAVSEQQITSGDGSVRFQASELDASRVVGLSARNSGTGIGDIRYGIRLRSGLAQVVEHGTFRKDVPVASGDTLEIRIANGVVQYLKNGAVVYTSGQAVQYPLMMDTSMSSIGAVVRGATIKVN